MPLINKMITSKKKKITVRHVGFTVRDIGLTFDLVMTGVPVR